jgi:hypothetical protein
MDRRRTRAQLRATAFMMVASTAAAVSAVSSANRCVCRFPGLPVARQSSERAFALAGTVEGFLPRGRQQRLAKSVPIGEAEPEFV